MKFPFSRGVLMVSVAIFPSFFSGFAFAQGWNLPAAPGDTYVVSGEETDTRVLDGGDTLTVEEEGSIKVTEDDKDAIRATGDKNEIRIQGELSSKDGHVISVWGNENNILINGKLSFTDDVSGEVPIILLDGKDNLLEITKLVRMQAPGERVGIRAGEGSRIRIMPSSTQEEHGVYVIGSGVENGSVTGFVLGRNSSFEVFEGGKLFVSTADLANNGAVYGVSFAPSAEGDSPAKAPSVFKNTGTVRVTSTGYGPATGVYDRHGVRIENYGTLEALSLESGNADAEFFVVGVLVTKQEKAGSLFNSGIIRARLSGGRGIIPTAYAFYGTAESGHGYEMVNSGLMEAIAEGTASATGVHIRKDLQDAKIRIASGGTLRALISGNNIMSWAQGVVLRGRGGEFSVEEEGLLEVKNQTGWLAEAVRMRSAGETSFFNAGSIQVQTFAAREDIVTRGVSLIRSDSAADSDARTPLFNTGLIQILAAQGVVTGIDFVVRDQRFFENYASTDIEISGSGVLSVTAEGAGTAKGIRSHIAGSTVRLKDNAQVRVKVGKGSATGIEIANVSLETGKDTLVSVHSEGKDIGDGEQVDLKGVSVLDQVLNSTPGSSVSLSGLIDIRLESRGKAYGVHLNSGADLRIKDSGRIRVSSTGSLQNYATGYAFAADFGKGDLLYSGEMTVSVEGAGAAESGDAVAFSLQSRAEGVSVENAGIVRVEAGAEARAFGFMKPVVNVLSSVNLVNSGTMSVKATGSGFAFGAAFSDPNARGSSFTNSGSLFVESVSGQAYGFLDGGSVGVSMENSGTLVVKGGHEDPAQTIAVRLSGTKGRMVNTGTIASTGLGVDILGGDGFFENSGTVRYIGEEGTLGAAAALVQISSGSVFVNSGRVLGSVKEGSEAAAIQLSGDSEALFQDDSFIEGAIQLKGPEVSVRTEFAQPYSLRWTFSGAGNMKGGVPEISGTAPTFYDAEKKRLVVLSPIALEKSVDAFLDFSENVSNLVRQRPAPGAIGFSEGESGGSIWVSGFAGRDKMRNLSFLGSTETDSLVKSEDLIHTKVAAVGIERAGGFGVGAWRVGAFAGYGQGTLDVMDTTGFSKIFAQKQAGFFGGVHGGRRFGDSWFVRAALLGGSLQHEGEHFVNDNLVETGLSKEKERYRSYWFAPEIGVGAEVEASQGWSLIPSLQLSYTRESAKGHEIFGGGAGATNTLFYGDRVLSFLTTRGQLVVQRELDSAVFTLRGGFQYTKTFEPKAVTVTFGDSEKTLSVSDASRMGFFGGAGVDIALSQGASLGFSGELLLKEQLFDVRAGVKLEKSF